MGHVRVEIQRGYKTFTSEVEFREIEEMNWGGGIFVRDGDGWDKALDNAVKSAVAAMESGEEGAD